MTLDEELAQLEDWIRRLKIEYDIYFNGGSPRPPHDLQWKIETTIKRYGEGGKMTFGQRFKYNGLVQKFAIYNDMWRQKVKYKEEGRDPRRREEPRPEATPGAFRVQWHDPEQEQDKVEKLFQALVKAKKQVGEATESLPLESFKRFVKQKTDQLKKDLGCRAVEYVVEVENGQVRLKAKGTS